MMPEVNSAPTVLMAPRATMMLDQVPLPFAFFLQVLIQSPFSSLSQIMSSLRREMGPRPAQG